MSVEADLDAAVAERLTRARELYDLGDQLGFIAEATALLERYPDVPDRNDLRIELACAYSNLGRVGEGVAHAEMAWRNAGVGCVRIAVDALGIIAEAHAANHEITLCITALVEADRMLDSAPDEPKWAMLMRNLGVSFERCGFFDDALRLYDAVRASCTDPVEVLYADACATVTHLSGALTRDLARSASSRASLQAAVSLSRDRQDVDDAHWFAGAGFLAFGGLAAALLGDIDWAEHCERRLIEHGGELVLMDVIALDLLRGVIEEHHGRDGSRYLDAAMQACETAPYPHFTMLALHLATESRRTHGDLVGADHFARRLTEYCLERVTAADRERRASLRALSEHHAVERLSRIDPLTGLLNRRGLDRIVDRVWRSQGACCIAVVDLDGFKSINDTYGHAAGDIVLRAVATTIAAHTSAESSARIGGDEFVILHDGAFGDLMARVDAIRREVAALSFTEADADFAVTLSIGVAPLDRAGVAWRAADEAMLMAKRAGRNRIVAA